MPRLFGAGMYSAIYLKRSVNNSPEKKPLSCKICQDNDGTELVGVDNQCLISLKVSSMRRDPNPTLLV